MPEGPALYRVTVGRDEYLGSAVEVLGFLTRAEGAPSRDARGYMRAVARRVRRDLNVPDIPDDDPEAFLLALAEHRVIRLERAPDPLEGRVDRRQALGDGPVAFSEGVDPDDLPL